MIAFDTRSLFPNVPYKMVHTNEITALSRRWKMMPTAIGLPVSKIHIIFFCVGAAKCVMGWLFVEVSRSHTQLDTDTLGTNAPISDQLVTYPTNTIHKKRNSFHILEYKPAKPGTKPLQIYASHRTASGFDVTT